MMAEYVTKEQVLDWFRPYGHMDEPIPFETMVSDLRGMPAVDVAPVRHGQWIVKGYVCGETEYQCSECKETEWRTSASRLKYCPFCGVKMDGDTDAT